MKYIKQYEEVKHFDKYVVMRLSRTRRLFILEVVHELEEIVYLKRLYVYDEGTPGNGITETEQKLFNFPIDEPRIIYTSDNLEQIFELIGSLLDAGQYNL